MIREPETEQDPVKTLIGTVLFQCRYAWKDNPDTFLTFPEQKFLENKAHHLGMELLSDSERQQLDSMPFQERNRVFDELLLRGAELLSSEQKELFEAYRYNKRRRQWFTSFAPYILLAVKYGYFDVKQSVQFRRRALRLEDTIVHQSFNTGREVACGDTLIDDVLDALFPGASHVTGASRECRIAQYLKIDREQAKRPVIAPLLHR